MTPEELKKIHDIAKKEASGDSNTSYTPDELKRLHKHLERESKKHN